jgi:S1-C subfamily serine protease
MGRFLEIGPDNQPFPPDDRIVLVALGGPRVRLGVHVEHLEDGGVRVTRIEPHSIAERDGIRRGDQFLQADGREVEDVYTLVEMIDRHAPEDRVEIVIERDGAEHGIPVVLDVGRLRESD